MAQFDFCSTSFLGISHCGTVTAEGYGTIELSDEEVAILVNLIKEKGTTDVSELELEKVHPELFNKLDEAYREAALSATIDHWYMEGFNDGCYEYDIYELMEYCKVHHDFVFEYDEEDYLDEDGEIDEDVLCDDEMNAFTEWLEDLIYSMGSPDRIRFMTEHMNADIDMSEIELDYCVEIPGGVLEIVGCRIHI